MLKETLDSGIQIIRDFMKINETISIGEARDLLQSNRKVSLGLLEYLDNIKITKRDGEKRTLIIN